MTVAPARSLARVIDPPRWLRAALSITAPLTIAGAAAGLSLAGIAVGPPAWRTGRWRSRASRERGRA